MVKRARPSVRERFTADRDMRRALRCRFRRFSYTMGRPTTVNDTRLTCGGMGAQHRRSTPGTRVEIRRSALIGLPAERTFDLIEAAEHYPEFLPWCSSAV